MSTTVKSERRKSAKTEHKRPKRESSRSRTERIYYEPEEELKVVTKRASPARNKSPGRKKTPSRKKSPARNKSPSGDESAGTETQRKSKRVLVSSPPENKSPSWKSPARKSPSRRSPGRKSPSRTSPARIRAESNSKLTTSIHTSTPLVDTDADSDFEFKPLMPSARSRISRHRADSTPIKQIESKKITTTQEYYGSKRSSALSGPHDTERVVHLKNVEFTPQEKNLTEFSDEDDLLVQSKHIDLIEPKPYKVVFVTEYGGWFGAIFSIILLPIFAITLHLLCNSKQCAYQLPTISIYKDILSCFDITAFLSFTAYLILLMLLSALPFGGKKIHGSLSKYGKTTYIANGWISLLVVHVLLLGLEFSTFGIVNYIYDKYFALSIAMILHGILFSIYLYIRSHFIPVSALNPNGDTNSIVYNFFIGREINPIILDIIHVKIFLLRMAFVTLALVTTVIVYKSLSLTSPLAGLVAGQFDIKSLNFDATCLTLALMWYIYIFDGIFLLEKLWSTTFEMQHEGIGYLSCFMYFALPSVCGTIIKYVYDYDIQLSNWLLMVAFLQFLIGYVIYSGSNRQKGTFRKNPYSPSVTHLEAIPTAQGKKLIVSGFWGIVRHPNYLGDIILQLSFFYFVYNVPPGLICLITIPLLMHRAKRDGFKCKQKYEAAWDRYCQRVKYVLIPKVY